MFIFGFYSFAWAGIWTHVLQAGEFVHRYLDQVSPWLKSSLMKSINLFYACSTCHKYRWVFKPLRSAALSSSAVGKPRRHLINFLLWKKFGNAWIRTRCIWNRRHAYWPLCYVFPISTDFSNLVGARLRSVVQNPTSNGTCPSSNPCSTSTCSGSILSGTSSQKLCGLI